MPDWTECAGCGEPILADAVNQTDSYDRPVCNDSCAVASDERVEAGIQDRLLEQHLERVRGV